MPQFEVFHRRDRITFTGEHLAHASSWRPHSARWAELDLYSAAGAATNDSESGVWVFSRVGHSRLYHMPASASCPRRLPYGHQIDALPPIDDLVPCPVCEPAPAVLADGEYTDFLTTHVFETPRPYAVVCDSAAMVDRQLRSPDGSMGWLSMRLAIDAASADPALAALDPVSRQEVAAR